MTVSLATLLVKQTKEQIYEYALGIATALKLPVTSWQAGDPTRSLYHLESELLAKLEEIVSGYVSSGFLDFAIGDWRKVVADQTFGVSVPLATYATTTVRLTNAGGAVYDVVAGDLVFKNTATGKTYHSTSGGTLAAKVGGADGTLDVTVSADEPGSESSAGAGEIDDLVTTLLGVTCANATAAIGIDAQDWETTKLQCRAKHDAVSPNGSGDAPAYVARSFELTGTANITRARAFGDSDTGFFTVFLAGPSGAVLEADRALAESAVRKWATPLCSTPTIVSASPVSVDVTYHLWVYRSCNATEAEVKTAVQTALEAMFAARPIGGDIVSPSTVGYLYLSLIESTIRGVYPQVFRVDMSLPGGDTALSNGQVAALGTVTASVSIEVDP